MFGVPCRKPVAIGFGIVDRNIHHRIVVLAFVIGKSGLEGSIFGIGDRRITYIGVRSGRTAQHHPAILRILVLPGVDKPEKLLLYPDIAVLHHLIHDPLHVLHDTVSLRLAFQLAEFVFLSCHHFVVADAHPLQ